MEEAETQCKIFIVPEAITLAFKLLDFVVEPIQWAG